MKRYFYRPLFAFKMACLALLLFAACSSMAQKRGAKAHAKKPAKTPEVVQCSSMHIKLDLNGQSAEIFGTQFKTADGTMMPPDPSGKRPIFFGASNDTDDKNFSVQAWVTGDSAGTYEINGQAGLMMMSSLYPDIAMFSLSAGSIVLEGLPVNGFVKGSFQGTGSAVTQDGKQQSFTISGDFKVRKP